MNPFNTALIKAPSFSRFDFNHSNTVGLRIGPLTPTLTEFVTPRDEVSVSMEQIARLAPMPVPTFTSLKVRHDFFFVPLRLLYGNDPLDKLFGAEAGSRLRAKVANLGSVYTLGSCLSQREHTYSSASSGPFPVPGTLMDYLGYPVLSDRNGGLNSDLMLDISNDDRDRFADDFPSDAGDALRNSPAVCIEKFFAYHFIWRDWYRFTGIQDNTIVEPFFDNGVLSIWNELGISSALSFSSLDLNSEFTSITNGERFLSFLQQDSVKMRFRDIFGDMRLAHLTKDMFSSARFGNKPTVLIPTGSNGTIPALREASAIQRFLDIISITGQRYFDKVRGLFGVEPEGPKDDRVQFLARYQQFIKVGEVLTTATTAQGQTGDYAGRGILIDGKYLFKRRFTEHGYLFCISSVIPDVAYNGLGRDLTDVNVLDTPIPSLAQVGDQTIFNREVHFSFENDPIALMNHNNESFGDQFRYYAYKSHNNEVHGSFLMSTFAPWSPLLPIETGISVNSPFNVIGASRVYPSRWNKIFNDTSDEQIFGDRIFLNLDFYESIDRALPKYINYHL